MSFGRRLVPSRLGGVHVWERRPKATRPLLLLHMSPRSGRMYHRVMRLLTRDVIALDRPGSGLSDEPESAPTMDEYAAATLDVVDAMGIDEFDVIGTHTGAVEAVAVASFAPERIASIGLVAVPAYTDDEIADRRLGVAAVRPSPALDGSHLLSMWQRRVAIRSAPFDFELLGDLFLDELRSAPSVHWAYQAVLDYPMKARLSDLDRPVDVFAPHDDLWVQTDRSRLDLPAESRFVELPHLDFDLWELAADEMASLVDEYLPETPLDRP